MPSHHIELVAGKGLGVSYSSLTQIGPVLQSVGMGQAKLQGYVNVANGNLVFFDRALTGVERTGDVSLQYIYNSQAASWSLAIPRIKRFPTSQADPLVFVEADGHETNYTWYDVAGQYWAPAHAIGVPTLTQQPDGHWLQFNPHTQVSSLYNELGQLVQCSDARGRMSTYTYSGGVLSHITASSGTTYQLSKASSTEGGSVVTLSVVQLGGAVLATQLCTFNADKQLIKSEVLGKSGESLYCTDYTYNADLGALESVSQSDSSRLGFSYNAGAEALTLATLTVGSSGHVCNLEPADRGVATWIDGSAYPTTFTLDDDAHVLTRTSKAMPNPADAATNTWTYTYWLGQLVSVSDPSGAQINYAYNIVGQLNSVSKSPEQMVTYIYDGTYGEELSRTAAYLPPTKAGYLTVRRFVYQTLSTSGVTRRLKRFSISPMGRVTEYRYETEWYDCINERTYLASVFDLSAYDSDNSPSYEQMVAWAATQAQDKVSLTTFSCDPRSQIISKTCYTAVNEAGVGINNDTAFMSSFLWTFSGGCRSKSVLLTPMSGTMALKETLHLFDEMGRMTQKRVCVSAAKVAVTNTSYHAAVVTRTLPNGRVEKTQFTDAGNVSSTTGIVTQNQLTTTREERIIHDAGGRPSVLRQADGQTTYKIYGPENKLCYTISATGAVSAYIENKSKRYRQTYHYANCIDVGKLQSDSSAPVDVAVFDSLLVSDAEKDRVSYEIWDEVHRLAYKIDAENYVTALTYDTLNRQISTTRYATQQSDTVINQLLSGTDSIVANPSLDRTAYTYYNEDSQVVATLNPAGYLTEHVINASGNVQEKIHYETQTTYYPTLAKTRPAVSENDAHCYYFYDMLRRVCAEVVLASASVYYIKENTYFPNGNLRQKTQYANPTPICPIGATDYTNLLPEANPADKTSTYTYDLMARELTKTHSNQTQDQHVYTLMGHVSQVGKGDNTAVITDQPKRRSHLYEYNLWGEQSATCPPLVADLIFQVEQNKALSTEEKQAQITAIWLDQSVRYHLDPVSGLRMSRLDSLDNQTLYFYTVDRQLALTVHPDNSLTTYRRNAFGEVIEERHYATALTVTQRAGLVGGFMTTTLSHVVSSLENDAIDAVTQTMYSLRSKVLKTTDPAACVHSQSYNAFKEVIVAVLPTSDAAPIRHKAYTYEKRGLCITETQTAAENTLVIEKQYDNPLGHCTQHANANGEITQWVYSPRGDVKEKINALGGTTHYTNNAFMQHTCVVNAIGVTVLFSYNQVLRTELKQYKDSDGVINLGKVTTTYNAFREVILREDALGRASAYTHNAAGKTCTTTNQLGETQTNTYDTNGQLIAEITAAGIRNTFSRNTMGQVITVCIGPGRYETVDIQVRLRK